jgi:capsular polysaccharide transport system permease protein
VSSRPSKAERVAARRAAAEKRAKIAPAAAEPAPAPSNTVVPLPQRVLPRRKVLPPPPADFVVPSAARRAGAKKKRSVVRISAVLAIALPTGLATLYYGVIAAPQYVAEARFAVRGPADIPSRGADGIGALAGMGASPLAMISDSFIVAQFIESGQLVGNMQRSLDLRSIYTNDKADFVAKYRPYGAEDTIEHLTSYWNTVSWVYFEPVTGIITFTVRAFSPEQSLKIARETVRESERLVNRLSDRAREDSVRLAKQEQSRAELRLKFARKAIQDYRDRSGAPDAQSVVTSQFKIVSDLEGELAKREAELGASAGFLSKDSPSVRVKQTNIDSLRSRITAERAKIGSQAPGANGGKLLSASMAEYENLETERSFAEKAYESASQAVEGARVNAERQSRYLTTFVEPYLPEDSLYPARLKMILLVFVCSAIAWAVGALIFYGIRDHSA